MQTSERLDLTFAALADPTRRAIIARLLTRAHVTVNASIMYVTRKMSSGQVSK